MKKSKNILSMLMIGVLIFALVQVSVPVQAAKEEMPPVYSMYFESTDQYLYTSGCYVADEAGNTYFVTIWQAKELIDEGFEATVISGSFEAPAEFVTRKGNFAFFSVPELAGQTPLRISDQVTSTAYAWILDSDGSVDEDRFEINDTWVDAGEYLYNPTVEDDNVKIWGSPILNEDREAVGIIYITNDNEPCIPLFSAVDFPKSAIISGDSGDSGKSGGSSGKGSGDSDNDDGGSMSWIIWVLLGLGGAAAFGFFMKKKRDSNGEGTLALETDSVTAEQGTISLIDPDDGMSVVPVEVSPLVSAPALWQIRAMGGVMEGRVFLVSDSLRMGRSPRCDVVFDQNTPGISGEHCQLRVENGQVILQDLQSTYGTYLSKKVRLEPQVDYHLQLGDEFTMAEGGQTFRLEQAGSGLSDVGPAVKGIHGGRIYRADIHGRLIFGRDPRNQVVFDAQDMGVSGNHCVLYRENGGLFLMDNGSSNGTFFEGGQRLRPNVPYPVKKGQSFYLTAHKNTFVITED